MLLIRKFNDDLAHLQKGLRLWVWVDENRGAIKEKLAMADDALAKQFLGLLAQNPPPYSRSKLEMREMCLCRAVDKFQTIMTAFVGEVVKVNPDTLRAAEPVDVSFVLDCGTIDEFRQRIAARKLRQLGRFSEVRKFLREQFGVTVNLDAESDRELTAAIAVRNVLVHNGGRADEEFLRLTGRGDLNVGDAVEVTDKMVRKAFRALHSAADAFQMAFCGKFFGLGGSNPNYMLE